QHRPLPDHQDEDDAPEAVLPLAHRDVTELPGTEERGEGPLDVAIVGGLAADQPRGPDHLLGGEPGVPLHRDAVQDGRGHGPGILGPGDPRDGGEQGECERSASEEHAGETGRRRGPEGSAGAWGRGQALDPLRARKASRSPSGATSTSISSVRVNSPRRSFSLSGSSMYFWIARLSGRAP